MTQSRIRPVLVLCVCALLVAPATAQQYRETGEWTAPPGAAEPAALSQASSVCVECHAELSPGIVEHWRGSGHADAAIGCFECHQAKPTDPDAFDHMDVTIAVIVTPLDCARCHEHQAAEFAQSHHAAGGNILASLDNFLAETVEGSRVPFAPHSPTPGRNVERVNGLASATSGCKQCHGSKVGLRTADGAVVTLDDFQPDAEGTPTQSAVRDRLLRDGDGRPVFDTDTWPNTGIGRLNLDGSRGSCTACHSRHDFSRRRARQPENCAKCHLGPDHPHKEIFEESKHGVAYRDLIDDMNLSAKRWVLGEDYSAAPTCATCHMSGNSLNNGRVTHDAGERISWTNRPPISLVMDTDAKNKVVKETDPAKRQALVVDTWQQKRERMQNVCFNCHTVNFVEAFYTQYDEFIVLYNEKFGKPGQQIMGALRQQGLLTPTQFDEEIEWTWFYLWHHEGRRARHGASMMAPDYAHWHGMYEVAERFYMQMVPQAREITAHAAAEGRAAEAHAVNAVIDGILARPEHRWQNPTGGE